MSGNRQRGRRRFGVALSGLLSVAAGAAAQQRADSSFDVSVAAPAYPRGQGPVVVVDAGHHNFHTIDGRYRVFAEVLRADGFRVRDHRGPFTAESLDGVAVVVVANAGTDSVSSWSLPTPPAFTDAEADELKRWVDRGGALLLIADHMPAAGATAVLGDRFGVRFTNGYTLTTAQRLNPIGDLFSRGSETLLDHPITRGRTPAERIDSVVTFTGQAFQVTGDGVEPVLVFGPDAETLLPVRAGVGFDSTTPRVHSGRWPHAAVAAPGRGRVAIFGEAAMFSAQVAGPRAIRMGMNNPAAARNKQLLLNVARWLARLY